jgi:hypothetical protein
MEVCGELKWRMLQLAGFGAVRRDTLTTKTRKLKHAPLAIPNFLPAAQHASHSNGRKPILGLRRGAGFILLL